MEAAKEDGYMYFQRLKNTFMIHVRVQKEMEGCQDQSVLRKMAEVVVKVVAKEEEVMAVVVMEMVTAEEREVMGMVAEEMVETVMATEEMAETGMTT